MSKRTRELISCIKGCLDILYDIPTDQRYVENGKINRQIRRSEAVLGKCRDEANKGQGNGSPALPATNTGE